MLIRSFYVKYRENVKKKLTCKSIIFHLTNYISIFLKLISIERDPIQLQCWGCTRVTRVSHSCSNQKSAKTLYPRICSNKPRYKKYSPFCYILKEESAGWLVQLSLYTITMKYNVAVYWSSFCGFTGEWLSLLPLKFCVASE